MRACRAAVAAAGVQAGYRAGERPVQAVWMGGPSAGARPMCGARLIAEGVPVALARPLTRRELEELGPGSCSAASVAIAQPISLATPWAWRGRRLGLRRRRAAGGVGGRGATESGEGTFESC